ncbi:MAG TPA: sugar-binding domain-containing protein [Solirubrobacteraceae bacterium]|nr:sugar-binding domain-containing protein [Solirubrobacteraceae bacterium]
MRQDAAAGPAALVLMATVARRYYVDEATKSDIAAELGLSRFKVARLLEQARAAGIVRIEIESPGQIDLDLSVRLSTAYALRHCVVVDGPEDDEPLLRRTLGRAAADLLAEVVEPGDVLGMAWARSVMALRGAITRLARCDVVQLTGAMPVPDLESPVELVRDIARVSGGAAYVYYAPMFLPDAATARALRTQPEVVRATRRFPEVTKAVVGVGAWQAGLSTVADAVTAEERRAMYDRGVRSELSGIQLDERGTPVTTSVTERLIAIDADRLRAVPEVIAIVYGPAKAAAVQAALRGGFVTSLVTHAPMARALLERP